MSFKYPQTKKQDLVENLHGQDVPDPYRWMEDDASGELDAWVGMQNAITRSTLDAYPGRERIRERLAALWNHASSGIDASRARSLATRYV